MLKVVALAVALLAPVIVRAEIYGWVDPNGEVTYSNLPPPDSARVFDVMQEQAPAAPKAVEQAARSAQLDALNDRLRLLELEQARAKRQVVDYPAPPPSPPGVGCGPGGAYDCLSDPGPYYTTGILYGQPIWGLRQHDSRRHRNKPGAMTLRTGTPSHGAALSQRTTGSASHAIH
jgi:hypothetical protein